jgi:hypothetical protein
MKQINFRFPAGCPAFLPHIDFIKKIARDLQLVAPEIRWNCIGIRNDDGVPRVLLPPQRSVFCSSCFRSWRRPHGEGGDRFRKHSYSSGVSSAKAADPDVRALAFTLTVGELSPILQELKSDARASSDTTAIPAEPSWPAELVVLWSYPF